MFIKRRPGDTAAASSPVKSGTSADRERDQVPSLSALGGGERRRREGGPVLCDVPRRALPRWSSTAEEEEAAESKREVKGLPPGLAADVSDVRVWDAASLEWRRVTGTASRGDGLELRRAEGGCGVARARSGELVSPTVL
jgi:hypothetical protein